MPKAGS